MKEIIHVVGEHAPSDVAGTCFFFFLPLELHRSHEFCFFRLKCGVGFL